MGNAVRPVDYVFGYGSLLRHLAPDSPDLPARVCRLEGYRRTWNVAMDNSRTVAGYKYYRAPGSGDRPPYFVTFLNLAASAGSAVNGAVFPVEPELLAALDRRERNYARLDVSELLGERVDGCVWTYVGTQQAEARFRAGAERGLAVISREYLEHVRRGFADVGEVALREFESSTDAPACPVVDLLRVDVPAR